MIIHSPDFGPGQMAAACGVQSSVPWFRRATRPVTVAIILLCWAELTTAVGITCDQANQAAPPKMLSQTCLYTTLTPQVSSAELHLFTPNYQLWSDAAEKTRWVYLPAGRQINTDDPDRWVFPIGTQFFKEFRKRIRHSDGHETEIKVETRHLMKIRSGQGLDSWAISTYKWQPDQSDAILTSGEKNVLGTSHDIPTEENCITCHMGNIDGILGFDAIQLSDAQLQHAFGHGPKRTPNQWSLQTLLDKELLSTPMAQPTLPGNPVDQKVLGYLHANCGNCHNPLGHAAEQEAEHLKLRHKLAFQSLQGTDVYHTAVNRETRNFTIVPYIAMGAKHEEMALYQSAMFLRMNSLDEDYRMPMIATEEIDYDAVALLHQWLMTLPTPREFDFKFDQKKNPAGITTANTSSTQPLFDIDPSAKGLHVQLRFHSEDDVPPVIIIYWPEDNGLEESPMMDHKEGYFTQKLIVGKQGSVMSLRNSDDVGHTIYVKDKRQDIRWQLNYMPPGSRFEQDLFWEEDTFVEMRCRLHLYMSAWAGSISSRYYTIIEFKDGETVKNMTISDIPPEFSQVKVWMPRTEPIQTRIAAGETKQLDIGDRGQLTLKRVP